MPSRKFRRKYQQGGSVIPSFQGAQVLGQPQRIEQRVNPIVFDPSSTFQAVASRQNSLQTAISQANLNRQERIDAWKIELDNRQFLEKQLEQSRKALEVGMDDVTKLDLNIPEQFEMAQNMRRSLDQINAEATAILTDNSLTPAERAQKHQEKVAEAKALFTDPNYIKHVQNNALTSKVYDGISKTASDGKSLIDFESANNNLELARKFQRGEIDRGTFFNGLKNFSLDPKAVDDKEKLIDQYIKDSLDPSKAATNWEQYKGDDDFLVFKEQFAVPDLESQVEAVFQLYKNDHNWLKVQEARGNRVFLDDAGLIDDEKLRDHVRRKIQLIRGSLGAEGKEITTDLEIRTRPGSGSTAGGAGGAGGAGRAATAGERRNQVIQSALNNSGYTVVDPSMLDQLGSATEAIVILETPDSELSADDKVFKRQLERAVKPTSSLPAEQRQNPVGTTASRQIAPLTPQERLDNVNFDDSGFIVNDGLQVGDNNAVVPQTLGGKDLGVYTNNPLNIKGSDASYPVIKRFDRNDKEPGSTPDTVFHRIFPTMEQGSAAGINLISRYKNGQNDTFNANLKAAGKTIEEATLTDMYKTWATGANDELIAKIAGVIGVSPDTPIHSIGNQELFMGMLSVENPDIFEAFTGRRPSTPTKTQTKQATQAVKESEEPYVPGTTVKIDSQIKELQSKKKDINAANKFGDDVSEVIEPIDREIKRLVDNRKIAKSAMQKVDAVGPTGTTNIEIGPPTVIPSTGLASLGGGAPIVSKNIITVERSKEGDTYRVRKGDKILADQLTRQELDRYLEVAAGRTRTELTQITGADIGANVPEPPKQTSQKSQQKPAASQATGQQQDMMSKYYGNQ